MDLEHIMELLTVLVGFIGAQKGIQFIQYKFNGKKYNNPSGERRTAILTSDDRDFIRKCVVDGFDHHRDKMELILERGFAAACKEIRDSLRD